MKRILIIEDDPLIEDVYSQKLRSEGFAVDVAADGQRGLEIFNSRRPDLVFLDLLMPHLNGVELLKRIRSEFTARELPVLVFTNAYLGGIMQQAWEAGANQVIPKVGMRASLVVQMVKNALEDPPPPAVPTRRAARRKTEFDPLVRKKFLDSSSETLAALWRPLKELARRGNCHDSHACLRELFRVVRPLTATAAMAGLQSIAQMSSALEALLKNLCDKPERLSPSVLLTITQGIDTLKFLFAHADDRPARRLSAARILVVDDDEFTRRAVSRALARVNLRAICVDNPISALKRRIGTRFDLIILDIELPDASGFDLCSQLRAMPACKDTPIVFLSMHRGYEHRMESALRGGNDYITKPFLYMELAVKALSFVIRGPLKPAHTTTGPNGKDSESALSRRDVTALKQTILGSFEA